jgi:pimeloyl-ACP methyl ester carboxylesterase
MDQTTFAVECEGARLVGERRTGDAVPLILVHGFGGSRRDWDPLVAALPPAWPLIRYDQRGFGKSAAAAGVPFSHAEDLVTLLDAFGLEQVDLCGVSLGGATVLGCALQAPHRVRRLVLVSPMLSGWSWSTDWVEHWKAIGRKARAGEIEEARSLWWSHPLFAPVREGPRSETLRQAIQQFSGQQWIRDDQRHEWPMVERLHEVELPTLLLTGALDLPDFRVMADLIEGASPAVQRIDYTDAGHLLTLEKPCDIAAEIAAFLSA